MMVESPPLQQLDETVSKELFDWERNAPFYLEEVKSPLFALLDSLKTETYELNLGAKGQKILDFGAGTGYFSSRLLDWGHLPVTLDFSPKMLQLGKEQYRVPMPVRAIAPPIPFKQDSFDGIVANGMLHHCKAQNRLHETVREIFRVLKPGGALYLYDRNGSFFGRNLHHFVMFVRSKLERSFAFSSSSSSIEPDFDDRDIRFITETGFTIHKRVYVSTLFTFSSIVLTNTVEYLGFPLIARISRRLLYPLALLSERLFCFKGLTIEQCVVFKKHC